MGQGWAPSTRFPSSPNGCRKCGKPPTHNHVGPGPPQRLVCHDRSETGTGSCHFSVLKAPHGPHSVHEHMLPNVVHRTQASGNQGSGVAVLGRVSCSLLHGLHPRHSGQAHTEQKGLLLGHAGSASSFKTSSPPPAFLFEGRKVTFKSRDGLSSSLIPAGAWCSPVLKGICWRGPYSSFVYVPEAGDVSLEATLLLCAWTPGVSHCPCPEVTRASLQIGV